jgi:hypothetical protein
MNSPSMPGACQDWTYQPGPVHRHANAHRVGLEQITRYCRAPRSTSTHKATRPISSSGAPATSYLYLNLPKQVTSVLTSSQADSTPLHLTTSSCPASHGCLLNSTNYPYGCSNPAGMTHVVLATNHHHGGSNASPDPEPMYLTSRPDLPFLLLTAVCELDVPAVPSNP